MAVDADSAVSPVIGDNVPVTVEADNVTVPGSYDDLNNDIQNIVPGSIYDVTRDYKFDAKGQTIILNDRIITISQDNIVIRGNGHTIDAGGSQTFAIFKIVGNNVTIMDLNFINSEPGTIMGPTIYDNARYQKVLSPICWYGNDGVMQGCNFYNCESVNGGAVTWMGDNGTINNCLFENCTARGVGGAIYIGGTNTVSNCRFVNSSSQLSGEAIYIDRNRKNIHFINDTFVNSYPTIDGAVVGMDANYLYYSYMVYAYGDINTGEGYRMNIIPLIYKALVMGGVIKIDDIFSYYGQYNNATGTFTLNIVAHEAFPDSYIKIDADYLKSFSFSNVSDINQVFDAVIHGNYKFDITQVFTGYISSNHDYEFLSQASAFGLWFNTDKGVRTLTNGLKVIFTDKLVIDSATTWDAKKMGYDTITIMGNGSIIRGGAGDRDEKKWLVVDDNDVTLIVNDLTISGFNTAVECLKGTCYFTNVNFDGNRMDYWIDRDWGAAILNTGVIICNNCSFTNNYAKYGGAIFNQGYLSLDNCTFKGNTAYGDKGDNVCVGDGGAVCINNESITTNNAIAYFAQSISTSTATWMTVVSVVGSFAIGFLAGVITANPIAGAAIGFAVGAALGTFTAAEIISSNYDINYDRLTTCLFVIGGSAVAGALGGVVGYWAVTAGTAAEPVKPGIQFQTGLEDSVVEEDSLIQTLFGK